MRALRLCALPFTVLILCGCERTAARKSATPPAPVAVATVARKTVPVQFHTIGTVKPLSTVAVRPRVGGQMTEVFFREGEFVKKGQKLFTIDPRPYEAAVLHAEATLAKSTALLKGAELDLQRLQRAGGGAIAPSELDAARTSVAGARASVAVDEAALASARLELGFTTITSPIDGRVGELLVNQGNLVEANSLNPLVIVNQVSPIAVTFALPESQFPAVASAQERGPLKVETSLRGGESSIMGTLAFIDNTVNIGSGTVMLKAEFPNTDRRLWPGQFLEVVLTIENRPDCVVVPSAAIQFGQKSSFVFLITPEKKAEMRNVTVAFESGNESVIASGLNGGELVVVEGQLRLVPGADVTVKSATMDSAEAGY